MSLARGSSAAPPTVPYSRLCWWLSKNLVLLFSRIWFRLRVEGRDNVPASGPVLLVANHASYLDPPMVGITSRRWVAFLAREGLARLLPMRLWLRWMGVALIDRDAPSKEVLRRVTACLAAGELVSVFPEGTRSPDGRVGPFKSGVAFLVRRTGAPVVPVGIDGAGRAMPRGARWPRPRHIVVRYGEVWPPERVLAEGGVEALRRRVAELAGVEPKLGPPAADPAPSHPDIDPSMNASADGKL